MKSSLRSLFLAFCILVEFSALSFAQTGNSLTAALKDGSNGEAVAFATVSLTLDGAKKPSKYVLSGENGDVKIDGIKNGSYEFRAELLGYVTYVAKIKVEGKKVELGEIKMKPDAEQLEAAKVSATGNAIVIKKDTVEYNASSFKTTENDMLADLLKKLPGVEVSEDGSITVNGETVKKITIQGKTFFLDDPQLATQNIPAKLVNKLKVIKKKSEQAEFTGIDDGQEETVIDLGVKPGMMNGTFGNIMLGGGADIPGKNTTSTDPRYQGAAFLGKFTEKTQISFVLNGNNTNNRGFNDLSGAMMGNMRGGGGGMGRGQGGWGNGNGITTSWMGGANIATTAFDGKMDVGGNYLYNHTSTDVWEQSNSKTFLADQTNYNTSEGISNTASGGHRFGMRLDHKFTENTSILFEPQFNFGTGSYYQKSNSSTSYDYLDGNPLVDINKATIDNSGANKNFNASGFMLFRQRLGIPGRTLTVMARYNFSNNDLDGINKSETKYIKAGYDDIINQTFTSNSKSSSLSGRMTYTEPLGDNFYVEANYSYSWNRNNSEKVTLDAITKQQAYDYSNSIINQSSNHEIGANALYQTAKFRAQVGFSAIPTNTYNSTTSWNTVTQKYAPQEYESHVWNWSPSVMVWGDINDDNNIRVFYRGNSAQPSVSKLMPVPDNTNPLNIAFGNPDLLPYFSHNINARYGYNNRKKFTSLSVNLRGGFVQDPIVSAIWYGGNGAKYSMPFNGPTSGNANFNTFFNSNIGKTNFSVSNMLRVNWSTTASYVGTNVDMSTYDSKGYYAFMNEFIENFRNPVWFNSHITTNRQQTLGAFERFRLTYRNDALELIASGRTRVNRSWYSIATEKDATTTWNNGVETSVNWTWESVGLVAKADFNYNWYNGYSTQQPSEYILNAEIQKLLFKKKVTLSIKGYDILGQSKNLTVTDTDATYSETVNNTLGRYIVCSLTWRFGTFDKSKMRGPGGRGPGMGGGRGPGGPPRF